MKQTKTTEMLVGMFVAAGIAALFVLAMQVSNLSSFTEDGTYTLTARFDNIGGLKVRSAVKAAGVLVGRVGSVDFDNDSQVAVVKLHINQRYNRFSDDTSASIFTAGLLGEQYIGLESGGSDEYLADGSEIDEGLTQSAIVLEKLISKFVMDKASGK
ncbi:phospholipid/cholesterol/gamma-HCH transport system substrate-binding protein [Thiogranum longum]|uniref:Phospholipid/cholesterol/gamma-HCH transport system substrate-binding protein n=1 Tax=Thiogranum longum TaxID=1537524 RepID=A0A4R1HBH5_9GAMM|nr:outer membrane lipid asymmetry maintenance protein MlaD [Thiogranum longum]TCK17565.1 phospholipid/cholesterol/gamma-HCH transport system substrate-binding protein [Thiogranum longum]